MPNKCQEIERLTCLLVVVSVAQRKANLGELKRASLAMEWRR
jgi:hypothetical protein